MKALVGRIFAVWYFCITLGRVRGSSYILRSPSLLRVSRGASVSIGRGVMIDKGARIVVKQTLYIGDRVFIGKNATLIAFAPLRIDEEVLMGENVSVHTEDHGPAEDRLNFSSAPVSIGRRVWLGAGVVVTKGTTVGSDATVGANAVVTRDISPRTTAVGIPAREVGKRASSSR